MTVTDSLAAELKRISGRNALAYASPKACAASAADVPRLLAVVDAVLAEHGSLPVPGQPGDCYCPACTFMTYGYDDAPDEDQVTTDEFMRTGACGVRAAITRELTGEEGGDGRG